MITIKKLNSLSGKEEEFAKQVHLIYEKENGVLFNYKAFCFSAENEGNTVGIISGYTCYEEVYIDDLAVHLEGRNKGVGCLLLRAVEENFSGGTFNNINLVTYAFQAPLFYEKCGFRLEFIRKNTSNSKLDKYFYTKLFSE